jgi:hypothetical protein
MSKLIVAFRQSKLFRFVTVEVLVALIEHDVDGVPTVQCRSL